MVSLIEHIQNKFPGIAAVPAGYQAPEEQKYKLASAMRYYLDIKVLGKSATLVTDRDFQLIDIPREATFEKLQEAISEYWQSRGIPYQGKKENIQRFGFGIPKPEFFVNLSHFGDMARISVEDMTNGGYENAIKEAYLHSCKN